MLQRSNFITNIITECCSFFGQSDTFDDNFSFAGDGAYLEFIHGNMLGTYNNNNNNNVYFVRKSYI